MNPDVGLNPDVGCTVPVTSSLVWCARRSQVKFMGMVECSFNLEDSMIRLYFAVASFAH
jgi:hypothetical protein